MCSPGFVGSTGSSLLGETLRGAQSVLAVVAPEWLQQHSLPEWWERYALPFDVTRLAKSEAQTEAMALDSGPRRDGPLSRHRG
jgi:hypothetical protein